MEKRSFLCFWKTFSMYCDSRHLPQPLKWTAAHGGLLQHGNSRLGRRYRCFWVWPAGDRVQSGQLPRRSHRNCGMGGCKTQSPIWCFYADNILDKSNLSACYWRSMLPKTDLRIQSFLRTTVTVLVFVIWWNNNKKSLRTIINALSDFFVNRWLTSALFCVPLPGKPSIRRTA